MTDESQSYNLNTLRELLTEAFDPVELRALVAYDDRLKGLALEFASADPVTVMADKAIAWCDRRGVIGYLVDKVRGERADKVKDFEASLYRAGAPLPFGDAAAEVAKQAARLERERQEGEDAERRKVELEELYGQAAGRLKERDWAGACGVLAQIHEIEPGYRNTLTLLRQAETEQARAEQVAGLMAQGMGHLEEGKWWLANQDFRRVLDLAPGHAEALARIAEADSQEQIASRLVAGQNDLRAGRWSEAISHFEVVLKMEPAHREATKLMDEARAQERDRKEAEAREAKQAQVKAAEQAQREEEARQAELFRLYYVACLAAWEKDWPKAIENFEALLLRDLNYRDAADRLKSVRSLQFRDQYLRPGTTEQTEDLFGLRSTRNEALRLRGLQAPLLPAMGPRPPEDVLRVRREIQAAGTPQSQKKVAGKPAAAPKPAEWRTVAELRGHTGNVHRAAFSPDGKLVVTASEDKTARVWHAAPGEEVTKLRGHSDMVFDAAFSPDGKVVVTASGDGRARLWQAATGTMVTELRAHKKVILGMGWQSVLSAAFSPDGERVATASSDGKVRLWSVATGGIEAELGGGDQSAVRAQFSPGGDWLITANRDGTARYWAVQTGKAVAELRGHTGELKDAAFSPDGKRVVTAGEDGTARIWDVATGKVVRSLRVDDTFGVYGAALHPNGKWVATAAFARNAKVWDVETGKVVAVLRGHASHVVSVAFSPNGKWAVTGSHDTTARVWEMPPG